VGQFSGGRSIFKTRLLERKEIEGMAEATGFLGLPLSFISAFADISLSCSLG